jgi:carbamoyl-phosphate synthase large subunit
LDSPTAIPRFAYAGPPPHETGRHSRTSALKQPQRPMPKRTDLQSILILGSGPLVIGQAAEFDYLGDAGRARTARRGVPRDSGHGSPAAIMTARDLDTGTVHRAVTAPLTT